MRKGTEPVHITREDIERFAKLKRRLCAAPRLAHPNLEAPFTVYTDASNIALYAVILQRDTGGVERVIYFFFYEAILRAEKLLHSRARDPRSRLRARTL